MLLAPPSGSRDPSVGSGAEPRPPSDFLHFKCSSYRFSYSTLLYFTSSFTGLVQSIYAKKWLNPKQIATVMKHIPKVVKFYVVEHIQNQPKSNFWNLPYFYFYSARLTTLDRATAKVVLSVCPSLCHAPNLFCNTR